MSHPCSLKQVSRSHVSCPIISRLLVTLVCHSLTWWRSGTVLSGSLLHQGRENSKSYWELVVCNGVPGSLTIDERHSTESHLAHQPVEARVHHSHPRHQHQQLRESLARQTPALARSLSKLPNHECHSNGCIWTVGVHISSVDQRTMVWETLTYPIVNCRHGFYSDSPCISCTHGEERLGLGSSDWCWARNLSRAQTSRIKYFPVPEFYRGKVWNIT